MEGLTTLGLVDISHARKGPGGLMPLDKSAACQLIVSPSPIFNIEESIPEIGFWQRHVWPHERVSSMWGNWRSLNLDMKMPRFCLAQGQPVRIIQIIHRFHPEHGNIQGQSERNMWVRAGWGSEVQQATARFLVYLCTCIMDVNFNRPRIHTGNRIASKNFPDK
jgi:hypothetical protein